MWSTRRRRRRQKIAKINNKLNRSKILKYDYFRFPQISINTTVLSDFTHTKINLPRSSLLIITKDWYSMPWTMKWRSVINPGARGGGGMTKKSTIYSSVKIPSLQHLPMREEERKEPEVLQFLNTHWLPPPISFIAEAYFYQFLFFFSIISHALRCQYKYLIKSPPPAK